MLENEEAFQLKSFKMFSQNELFEELSLKKSLIRLAENPKIIKTYFDSNNSKSYRALSNFSPLEKREEIVSLKSKVSEKKDNSFEKGDDSQFSLSDYSFQKSEKNIEGEGDLLLEIKKNEEEKKENVVFNVLKH